MMGSFAGVLTVGSDPDLRYTPNGAAVCNVRAIASARRKNPQTQQWEDDDEKSTWYQLTGWRQLAENMAETLSKGMMIVVIGKVYARDWEDKDGNKRTSLEIDVDEMGPSIRFATAKVTKASRDGSGGGGGQSTPPAQDPWSTSPQTDEPPF